MILVAAYSLCLASALTVSRADEAEKPAKENKRPALTEEQKTARKDLLAKYDANKDGKLDREERKAVTSEDKEKMKKAGFAARQQRKAKKS